MDESDERPRARGINLAKFVEKCQADDFTTNMIPIYHRASRNAGLEALYQKYPREALITFSDKFRKQLLQKDTDTPAKAIYLDKGGDKEVFKQIFNWIKECIAASELVEFETFDEDAPDTIPRYLAVIRAAEYLEIPARDMQEKLGKRVRKLAKDQREKDRRIDWNLLEDLYDDEAAVIAQRLAASVIFFSWWNGHINSDDTPVDMEILAELREDYPKLDDDLNAEFEDQKRFLDERKAKRDAERNGVAGGDGGGWGEQNTAGMEGGGWGNPETVADTGDNAWDDTGAAAGGDGWDDTGKSASWGGTTTVDSSGWNSGQENTAPAKDSWDKPQDVDAGAGGVSDWAEEVNDSQGDSGNGW